MRWKWAIIPLLFTLISVFQDPIFDALQFKTLGGGWGGKSWAVFLLLYGLAAPVLVMALVDGGFARIVDELGLTKNPIPALTFAFLVTSPSLIGYSLTAQPNPALTPREIVMGGVYFPFLEEAFFRGFLFGQLYIRAGWNFWAAALVPAVAFALAHYSQSQDPAEIAGIMALTGTGAILFSYVFMQWGGNIWAPFGCHAFLNIWWSVFAIDDTALGGQAANIFRSVAIILALGFCFLAPRFGWLSPISRSSPRSAPETSS